MSIFHSERARIEIQSFHQVARLLYQLHCPESLIVGYTTACFAAEKALKYLLDIENSRLQLGKSNNSLKQIFKECGHNLEKLYDELDSSTTKTIESHYSDLSEQQVLGTAKEVFGETKNDFVGMRYMDEDGSIPPSSFYAQVINATGSVMLTTHPEEYWKITREEVPWSEVKGDVKTHFEKIGADPLAQGVYIPRVKEIQ